MALYALGDLHLSFGTNKPMDIFGGRWEGYVDKLKEGLQVLTADDTLVIPGDLSWALGLAEAEADFAFLNCLPGRKLLVKGNHDYWWNTASKFKAFCVEHEFDQIELLHNNCHWYGETALCGTRGWFFEEDKDGQHDEKIFLREIGRLEASLKAAGDAEKICFLHYPPRYKGYYCAEIIDLMKKYGVNRCVYGHLHGDSHKLALEGVSEGIEYQLVAADYVQFRPVKIME